MTATLPAKIDDLTFAELRLANLVHPHGADHPKPLEKLNDEMLTRGLAKMVIQADWLAASRGVDLVLAIRNMFATGESLDDLNSDDMTFAELRLASHLFRIPTKQAMAQLTELANLLSPQTLERFMDGEAIDAQIRLLRQNDKLKVLASTLADMVIQIDRFAALNKIDLAAAIRQRFELEARGGGSPEGKPP